MPKPKLKKQSKRLICSKKYKIIKKVKEHNRKMRREEKNHAKKKFKPKDPGIPNLFPFKEQLLKQIEEKKQKEEEAKTKKKEARKREISHKRKLQDLQKDAERRAKQFAKKQAFQSDELNELQTGPIEQSRKSYYKVFKKVVEASDVVIQVLDARDPIGCRCPQLEELIMASGKNKKLVFLLNKIDLIPKDIAEKWLKYLRSEFPAVAFKASTQNQRQKLSQSKVPVGLASKDLLQTSSCIGASTLLKLLGNYCRNLDIKTTITVGVVGFPNVGKSSVINSLKRSRACSVGSTPGVTKNMQEVQLDQHVKLLDCPGIVVATGSSDTQIILRNAVKVESLDDPVKPVEAILNRSNKSQVMQKYCVADYSDANEFLSLFAKRLGKLKKGGIPDQLAAAKVVLQDWNSGKITFYTHPPERRNGEHDTTAVVQYWGAGFDLKALHKEEQDDMKDLLVAMDTALVLEPGKPTNMGTEETNDEVEESEVEEEESNVSSEEEMDDKDSEYDLRIQAKEPVIALEVKSKKDNLKENQKKEVPKADGVNVQINRNKKKAFKSQQKEKRKRMHKLLEADENKMKDNDDDTYDFNDLMPQ